MFDLHIHTNYSDGVCSVEQVLKMAEEKKLNTISITDHNTTIAYVDLEIEKIRKIFTGKIIYGIEMITSFKGSIIEILGYGFDNFELIDKFFEDFYNNLEKNQIYKEVRLNLLKKIDNLNLKYDPIFKTEYNTILRYETMLYDSLLKCNEDLKDILKEEYTPTSKEFFRKIITNPNSKFYCDFSSLSPKLTDVLNLIKKNNGYTFLAHPYVYKKENLKEFLTDLYKEYKIDGIETYYYNLSKEETEFIKQFAKENKLLVSGGSDFHGEELRPNKIGDVKIEQLEFLQIMKKTI